MSKCICTLEPKAIWENFYKLTQVPRPSNHEEKAREFKGPGGRGPRGPKPKLNNPGALFKRMMKYILQYYTPHCITAVICIVVSVLANVQGTLFMQTLIDQ